MSRYERLPSCCWCGGFSYLWVLLLVALMGVGLTVAAEVNSVSVQRDRERELVAIGRQFSLAIGRYYESGPNREFPQSLDDLLRDPRAPGVRRHLRRIYVDPMTGKAEWGLVRFDGRIVGVHSLSMKRPIKQEGFEPSEAALNKKSTYSEWVFSKPGNPLPKPGDDARTEGGVPGADNVPNHME